MLFSKPVRLDREQTARFKLMGINHVNMRMYCTVMQIQYSQCNYTYKSPQHFNSETSAFSCTRWLHQGNGLGQQCHSLKPTCTGLLSTQALDTQQTSWLASPMSSKAHHLDLVLNRLHWPESNCKVTLVTGFKRDLTWKLSKIGNYEIGSNMSKQPLFGVNQLHLVAPTSGASWSPVLPIKTTRGPTFRDPLWIAPIWKKHPPSPPGTNLLPEYKTSSENA